MELYTNFYKILLFMKMYLPSSFIIRYVRAEMNVHAFMNEQDQKDYWYPRKIKNCENLCTMSMESCPLVISHILAQFHPERATYATLHNHFSWMDYPYLLKLLLFVVWGNFPFKCFKKMKICKWPEITYSFLLIDCCVRINYRQPVCLFSGDIQS